ncbi:MAG: hypothetical protein ACJ78Q_06700 [Chloroflexia bacterium]
MASTFAGVALFCLAGSMRGALPSVGSILTMLGGFGAPLILLLSMGLLGALCVQ